MSKRKNHGKSHTWAERQNRDQYVKKARSEGLRARSAFKLEQIDQKYRLIRPGMGLVDLGSAPGSWSQYAIKRIVDQDRIVAVDLLPMKAISGVRFIQGDFTEAAIIEQIIEYVGERSLDLVLSDMAPNITGIRTSDQARAEALQESILMFCGAALKPGGGLLTKIFEGESADSMRAEMKSKFDQFKTIKPDASRAASREIFLLGRGFRGKPVAKP